jgi:hypothetical protein
MEERRKEERLVIKTTRRSPDVASREKRSKK